VPSLVRSGRVRAIDSPLLGMMAMWYARWVKLAIDPDGSIQALQKAYREFSDIASKFGLDQHDTHSIALAEQSAVKTTDRESYDDPLAALLAARKG